jgi:hypothetical protein
MVWLDFVVHERERAQDLLLSLSPTEHSLLRTIAKNSPYYAHSRYHATHLLTAYLKLYFTTQHS